MAASCARSFIENYISGFEDSSAKDIANELQEGKASITDIIEHLGDFLTNKETSTRARATRLIADVLHYLPADFLANTQVSLLLTFLCEKLKDHFSLHGHALHGIHALSKSSHVSEELVHTVCRHIFVEVHVQSLPQADRRSVYNILLNFLTDHLSDVQSYGPDFVYGYIQVMDSEKDPRNLVLAFACALLIIQNIPLGVFVEEMFEVVSCYFPVDFSPSANDPSGIKKEDLILGLRRCLAASPKFAEYCLPLLMEKLTSDLKSAKIDSLDTLTACVETYGADSLYEFQSSLFNCIKKEVFLSGDPVLEQAALSALRAMVKTLSTGITQNDRKKSLDGFIEEILTECKSHLLQPELMLMLSSGRLLQSVAIGSDTACSLVTKATVPILLESHGKQSQPTPRYNVLQVLTGFIQCTSKFKYTGKNANPILSTYKDPVLSLYNQALEEDVTSLQLSAIAGFHVILSLPPESLSATERSDIASKLVTKSLACSIEDSVRMKCAETMRFMLSTFPESTENILPKLFCHLTNEPMECDVSKTTDKEQILSLLAAVTTGLKSVSAVMEVLCRLLNNPDIELPLFQATTKCLADVAYDNVSDTECWSILMNTGATSIHDLIIGQFDSEVWQATIRDEIVLTNMAAYLRALASTCPEQFYDQFQSLFINSFLNLKSTKDGNNSATTAYKFPPLETGTGTMFLCLLTPVLCAAPVSREVPHQAEIVSRVSKLVMKMEDRRCHTHVCKCLATIINRNKQDAVLDDLVSSLLKTLMSKMQTGSHFDSLGHVEALSWITKALVLRNHRLAPEYTQKLLDLLSDERLGHEAAQGVKIIFTDQPDVLNKAMRANIRLMYKQRFFIENLPKIIDGYSAAKDSCQKNYLLALSYLIQGLSKQALEPELPKIYPLLIKSLLCGDLDLLLVTMATLGDLISSCPGLVTNQIDSLVPQLLKMITYKESMKVRISALQCLKSLTCLPLHVIMPYRNEIVRAIKPVLDDKKRLVRTEAVAASLEWYLLETENKEK